MLDDVQTMRAVARILRKARAAKGWSQERLALRAGITRNTVRRYEQGEPLLLPTVLRLCIVLRVDLAAALLEDRNAPGRERWG